ncbi:MAG: response regulator [Candidatus Aminicenantes bacterium]|nr:MAG: response regulator [Candidatus Aminicenantes bacterium]RPJ02515.1 MAG: response regulator [Candidatus Aminicenantes bacterium]
MVEKNRVRIPRGNERILVVDDDRVQAESLSAMLERLGYVSTFATESLKALEMLRADPEAFDIIVTDQNMPHMAGTTLAEEAMRIRKDLPILICTGCLDKSGQEKTARLGIREIITKPFTLHEMAAAIRRALDGRAS